MGAQAGEPNFQSSHSVIGFIAVVLCWIQFLSGVAKAFGASTALLKQHGGIGVFAYVTGMAATLIAMNNGYICGNIYPATPGTYVCKNNMENFLQMFHSVSVVLLSGLTLMMYLNFRRSGSPSKNMLDGDNLL